MQWSSNSYNGIISYDKNTHTHTWPLSLYDGTLSLPFTE